MYNIEKGRGEGGGSLGGVLLETVFNYFDKKEFKTWSFMSFWPKHPTNFVANCGVANLTIVCKNLISC